MIDDFHVLFQMSFVTYIYSIHYFPGAPILRSMQTFLLTQNKEIKLRAVSNRYWLVQPSVFLDMVPPSVSTFFSSKTEPKRTCTHVLLLRFSLIHQISVSGSFLWSFFFTLPYRLDWGGTGYCILQSKATENFRSAWTWFHYQIRTTIFTHSLLLFQHLQFEECSFCPLTFNF